MKKLNIVVLCVATVMLAGCGSKDNTPQETTPEASCNDYKKLCEQGEFQKAYSIVEKYKADMQKYNVAHAAAIKLGEKGISDYTRNSEAYKSLRNKYEEAKKYVVLQESIYIIENQSINGITRLMVVAKEHDANWLFKELVDVAVGLGDEDLIERLSACAVNELEKEIDIFANNAPIDNPLPSGLHLCSEDLRNGRGENLENKYQNYIKEVETHNAGCMRILNDCIRFKKKDLANKAMSLFKKNMIAVKLEKTKRIDGFDRVAYYNISYEYRDKKNAERTLKEAVQNGEFQK